MSLSPAVLCWLAALKVYNQQDSNEQKYFQEQMGYTLKNRIVPVNLTSGNLKKTPTLWIKIMKWGNRKIYLCID